MLETAENYYRILDLEPGASPEEIHQGYLDLTWVWHPDRFVGNPRLQQKAQHKLQQINEAHARLRSFQAIPRTPKLHNTSKSQVSAPAKPQSPADSIYQQRVNQRTRVDDKQSVTNCQPPSGSHSRRFDEWLD